MPKRNKKTTYAFMAVFGALFTVWLALRLAPSVSGGFLQAVQDFGAALSGNPFKITLCAESGKTAAVFLIIYALVMLYCFSMLKNRRFGEEYGSAKWGDINKIMKKYRQDEKTDRIFTENIRFGLDCNKYRRNLFTMVVGGSGSRKTTGYTVPNILQGGTSMVILDPKGESVRATGRALENDGYEVRVLDLIHMEKSHRYNPFVYFRSDNDIQRLATIVMKATGEKDSKPQDPYWENAAEEILMALMMYLHYEAPPEEQNFATVMDMIRCIKVDDDGDGDEQSVSPVERLFLDLRVRKPDHPALRYYEDFIGVPKRTLETIKSTLTAKLAKFNIDSLISLTSTDEIGLDTLGEKKTALFLVIPDNDTSFNFIVSMLYMQAFQRNMDIADYKYKGMLPYHIHFIMDEFANVALPKDFKTVQATMRSRGMYASIMLQNMADLKALFEKDWESIVGNCDTFLFLGGNEPGTHEYVSKRLGKETLDTNTYNHTHGLKGNYSTNDQKAGRELLFPDEVSRVEDEYCILFIRGELPVMDRKYDLTRHPRIRETSLFWGTKEERAKNEYSYNNVTLPNTPVGVLGYLYPDETDPSELVIPAEGVDFISSEELIFKS